MTVTCLVTGYITGQRGEGRAVKLTLSPTKRRIIEQRAGPMARKEFERLYPELRGKSVAVLEDDDGETVVMRRNSDGEWEMEE